MPFHRKPSKAKRLSLVRYNMKGLTQMRDSEEKWGKLTPQDQPATTIQFIVLIIDDQSITSSKRTNYDIRYSSSGYQLTRPAATRNGTPDQTRPDQIRSNQPPLLHHRH
eukprot:gene10604-2726_t